MIKLKHREVNINFLVSTYFIISELFRGKIIKILVVFSESSNKVQLQLSSLSQSASSGREDSYYVLD